jgi:hypothetical protein
MSGFVVEEIRRSEFVSWYGPPFSEILVDFVFRNPAIIGFPHGKLCG